MGRKGERERGRESTKHVYNERKGEEKREMATQQLQCTHLSRICL